VASFRQRRAPEKRERVKVPEIAVLVNIQRFVRTVYPPAEMGPFQDLAPLTRSGSSKLKGQKISPERAYPLPYLAKHYPSEVLERTVPNEQTMCSKCSVQYAPSISLFVITITSDFCPEPYEYVEDVPGLVFTVFQELVSQTKYKYSDSRAWLQGEQKTYHIPHDEIFLSWLYCT
jgi:hypothetical protein